MRLKTFCVLLLIVIFGVFAYVTLQVRGSDDSSFNQVSRYKLGRYGWARALFSLHKQGDARAQYLFGSGPVVLEIVRSQNAELRPEFIDIIARGSSELINRQVQIYNVDIIKNGQLNDVDLDIIVKEKRRHYLPGQPNFFVMVVDDYQNRKQEAGKTYREFSALISNDKLKEITANYPAFLEQYLSTVILHEFGHQLGLKHNDGSNCIMNAKIESPDVMGVFDSLNTPTQFCGFEIEQLKNIKVSLK